MFAEVRRDKADSEAGGVTEKGRDDSDFLLYPLQLSEAVFFTLPH
jgi:hypothetical protein